MKILIAHNNYRSEVPSGENRVVAAEIELLRSAGGVEVIPMIEESDSIQTGGIASIANAIPGPIYSPAGVRRFRHLLQAEKPDVVHLHNVFPLISPWVIRIARSSGIPVVHTVHNYRHSCVKGVHYRDGRVCTDCDGKQFRTPAIRHACYRDSRLQSVPMVASQRIHRTPWRNLDAVVALTSFMRDRLVKDGFPCERITIRPSWAPDPGKPGLPGSDVIYVGRLDHAKGIQLLLKAWQLSNDGHRRQLRIIGDGPLREMVQTAAMADPTVHFEGSVSPVAIADAMRSCGLVVVPSLWFEGYPLVIAEAFSHGRPILTVEGGATSSIVDTTCGWVTEPNPEALAWRISELSDSEVADRAVGARARYESENTPLQALDSLLSIYQRLVGQ
jgi:glycosyltransferase involved in cell wall biosynthesis